MSKRSGKWTLFITLKSQPEVQFPLIEAVQFKTLQQAVQTAFLLENQYPNTYNVNLRFEPANDSLQLSSLSAEPKYHPPGQESH